MIKDINGKKGETSNGDIESLDDFKDICFPWKDGDIGGARFRPESSGSPWTNKLCYGCWYGISAVEGNFLIIGQDKIHFKSFSQIISTDQKEDSILSKFKDDGKVVKKYIKDKASKVRYEIAKEERERLDKIERKKISKIQSEKDKAINNQKALEKEAKKVKEKLDAKPIAKFLKAKAKTTAAIRSIFKRK
jgi:hypothetical protein